MKLRSLSIKGFKSFANDTLLNFNEQVIGIVGPNGSGKSNVVDAIRWVLGEQKNRELRLEQMQDVIFNGTKTRKAANSASVTLHFDNTKNILPTEYNSVSVSRILYRSGESEYRLNDVTCRLKDIRSLFFDTGIGSDSYAIIALGMVDDILADKENARRKMFEQAAGISKYKNRKKETEGKLRLTKVDLDRIEDILFELDGNLKVLKRQARRTQKYFDLKEKYKESSITLSLNSIHQHKAEYKELDRTLKFKLDGYRDADTKINLKEAQIESEKGKHLDKEIDLTNRQKELNEWVSKLRDVEEKKNLLLQNLSFKSTSIDSVNESIAQLETSIAQLDKSIEAHKEKLVKEKEIEIQLQQNYSSSKMEYDTTKLEFEGLKHQYDESVNVKQAKKQKLYDSEKELALLQNRIDTLRLNKKNADIELKNKNGMLAESMNSLDTNLKLLKSKVEEIEILEKLEDERTSNIEELSKRISDLKDTQAKIQRRWDAKQNEHSLLKGMIESFEGFPDSIKFLSKNWRTDIPILSDLIDVEEQYRTAIEKYLENYLNYYVVDNYSLAQEAILKLINAQKGKASFFVLENIDKAVKSYMTPSGTIAAIETIRVHDKYKPLMQRLLSQVYIMDDFIDQYFTSELSEDITVLSKMGTHVKSKYTLAGGSVGLFDGKKIGRKQNLEKLELQLSDLRSSLDKNNAELEDLLNKKDKLSKSASSGNMKILKKDKFQLDQESIRLKTRMESLADQISGMEEKKEKRESELKILEEQKVQLESVHLLLEKDLNEETTIVSDESLNTLSQKLNTISQDYNQHNILLIRQQNLIQNVNRELKFAEDRMDDQKKKLANGKGRLTDLNEQLIGIQGEIKTLESTLLEGYEQSKSLRSKLSEQEQSFFKARKVLIEYEADLKKMTRAQNALQIEIQSVKEKLSDVKFKMASVGERLRIEFEININDIINTEPTPVDDVDALELEVEKLRNRLQSFGEINPMAVETFNEMKGRYDLIHTQRQDVLDAQDTLIKTIKEIEDSATKQFLESFERIRDHFINVFRSLFTEDDNCDLILLDTDNPLESKIEIIAKPKGKRPKSLSQLSGGEKTLTATALLFALYLLKPAPFCIFDEVDAPLDDANIKKFNKIVKKFSKDSQFIIVTHNKSTMAAVDILYGVYMQHMGISEVTPVDFRTLGHQEFMTNLN